MRAVVPLMAGLSVVLQPEMIPDLPAWTEPERISSLSEEYTIYISSFKGLQSGK